MTQTKLYHYLIPSESFSQKGLGDQKSQCAVNVLKLTATATVQQDACKDAPRPTRRKQTNHPKPLAKPSKTAPLREVVGRGAFQTGRASSWGIDIWEVALRLGLDDGGRPWWMTSRGCSRALDVEAPEHLC